VIVAWAVWPSADAVITADPNPTVVTTPAVDTVATDVVPLRQVIERPVRTAPLASFAVAVSDKVAPIGSEAEPGAIAIDAIGTGITVIKAVAETPSTDAVTDAVPAPVPVTSPVSDTAATSGFVEVQTIVRPDTGFPVGSRGVAVNWALRPTSSVTVVDERTTDATRGGATVIVAVRSLIWVTAVIVAVPAPTAVTKPVLETRATAVELLVQR
jgi:hypothetical protein